MKTWSLLFLVACGGSAFTSLGDGTMQDGSDRPDGMQDGSDVLTVDPTQPTQDGSDHPDGMRSTQDGSDVLTDRENESSRRDGSTQDAFACDLSCEPQCVTIVDPPHHACCSADGKCHCSISAGYCAL